MVHDETECFPHFSKPTKGRHNIVALSTNLCHDGVLNGLADYTQGRRVKHDMVDKHWEGNYVIGFACFVHGVLSWRGG